MLYLFSIQVDEMLRYASVHCIFILEAEKAKPYRPNVRVYQKVPHIFIQQIHFLYI